MLANAARREQICLAEEMAEVVSASKGASEALAATSESTDSEIGEVEASRLSVVPFKSFGSEPAALLRLARRLFI